MCEHVQSDALNVLWGIVYYLSEDFPSWIIFNVASCEGLPSIARAFLRWLLSDDTFGEVAHIVEGILSVVIFSAVIVDEDGIIIIVGVKGMSCFFDFL